MALLGLGKHLEYSSEELYRAIIRCYCLNNGNHTPDMHRPSVKIHTTRAISSHTCKVAGSNVTTFENMDPTLK